MAKAGDRLGDRFLLEARVQAGGMGVVWRARDLAHDTTVAVKLIESTDEIDLERFRREVKMLAGLAHPAIVAHVGDGIAADGGYFLAMEWIEGVTVGDRLHGDGVSLAEAAQLVRRTSEGLAAAHRAGVVHRDIKPSNVMLAGGDPARATVIDLGVARERGVAALTRTGTAVGTPGYMAPEQARGAKQITPAADVFALGCLLYECATGTPAFSGTLASAVLAKILVAQPPPIERDCPEAPPALCRLVERMLAKHPDARPHDAGAVVDAIDAIGPIAGGPRRPTRGLGDDPTVAWRSAAVAGESCLVMAARGVPGDTVEPPTAAEEAALRERVAAHGATIEVLRTGAVVAQLVGARADVAVRAARAALAIREALGGWSIAISGVRPESARAIDDGTALLSIAAIADLFAAAGPAIAIDPSTAPLVAHEFEIDAGDPPRLRGRRRTGTA